MFYSCCIVYCLQSEENRTPFERQPRQPIMEVWSFCAAVCWRVSLLWLCLSKKQGALISHSSCRRGGSVIVSPNWLTLSLHERWGVLGKRRRRRIRKKRKGPKVYREVVKTVCKVLFTEALWSQVTLSLTVLTGKRRHTASMHIYALRSVLQCINSRLTSSKLSSNKMELRIGPT